MRDPYTVLGVAMLIGSAFGFGYMLGDLRGEKRAWRVVREGLERIARLRREGLIE